MLLRSVGVQPADAAPLKDYMIIHTLAVRTKDDPNNNRYVLVVRRGLIV